MLRRGVLQFGRRQIGVAGHQSASATVTGASGHLLHQRAPAAASSVLRAWFSSYPSHEVVGLPALSPVRRVCIVLPCLVSLSIAVRCVIVLGFSLLVSCAFPIDRFAIGANEAFCVDR